MRKQQGAITDKTMLGFLAAGYLANGNEDNVGPASYDLTLSNEVYRLPGVLKPIKGGTVQQAIHKFHGMQHHAGQALEVGVTYIARAKERLNLPEGVYGFANPKSTAGRLFLDVRLLVDGLTSFDTVPEAYRGDLWMLIQPRAFSMLLVEGDRLSQLRFLNANTRLSYLEMAAFLGEDKLIRSRGGHCYDARELDIKANDGACVLTLDFESSPIGWECVRSNLVMRYNATGAYKKEDFFRPVQLQGDCLRMQRGSRLILSTKELVRVPPTLACEMRPFDPRIANFRAHGAGFIDPGWGWGRNGDSPGRPLTLEIEPYEDDIIVQPNEPIAKIRFEHVTEVPEEHYDLKSSNYLGQTAAQLARQFI